VCVCVCVRACVSVRAVSSCRRALGGWSRTLLRLEPLRDRCAGVMDGTILEIRWGRRALK